MIQLNEVYSITWDDTCVTLQRSKITQASKKTKPENVGNVVTISVGHYATLDQACLAFLDRHGRDMAADDKANAEDVIKAYQDAVAAILEAVKDLPTRKQLTKHVGAK